MDSVEPSLETKQKLFARVDADLAARQASISASAAPEAIAAQSPSRRIFVWLAFAGLGLLVTAAALWLMK